jgi:hypothetical protein
MKQLAFKFQEEDSRPLVQFDSKIKEELVIRMAEVIITVYKKEGAEKNDKQKY